METQAQTVGQKDNVLLDNQFVISFFLTNGYKWQKETIVSFESFVVPILQVLFHPQSETFPTALCFSGALHPGDIITAMDGTTIEVKSRDGNRLGCPFSNLGLERVDMGGSFHMIPLGFLVQDFSQYDSVRLFCALNLWLKTFPPPYTSYYILLQQAMRYTSFLRGSFLATCHVGVLKP